MLEKEVEKRLKKRVEQVGGIAVKLEGTNLNGIPDRLVLFPKGRLVFVELKRPGGKPRKLQIYRMKQLEKLGYDCRVIDSYEGIEKLINSISTKIK